MSSAQSALDNAARSSRDIGDLLKAICVILGLSEVRLTQGLETPAEGLRKVNDDVRQLHNINHVLTELAMGIAVSGRNAIEDATVLIAAVPQAGEEEHRLAQRCHRQLEELSAAVQTILAVQKCMSESQEILEEAVLRRDPSPRLLAEVSSLLSRLRTPPAP